MNNDEVEICIDGMRGTVLLSEDCVDEGASLPSPINTPCIRNNKVIWYIFSYFSTMKHIKSIIITIIFNFKYYCTFIICIMIK
jgi:hypothetical protein